MSTPRKKFQSIGISPVTLHASMKTLKSNISEEYKVQVDCLKDSESDSYDKNDMEEKVNDLVRLHKAMQEELGTTSHSEQIQTADLRILKMLIRVCFRDVLQSEVY